MLLEIHDILTICRIWWRRQTGTEKGKGRVRTAGYVERRPLMGFCLMSDTWTADDLSVQEVGFAIEQVSVSVGSGGKADGSL